MKKIIILGSLLATVAAIPAASASIIIEPTIITGAPAYVEPVQVPVVIAQPVYPVHVDHHHHYDWRYWHERHEYNRR